MKLVEKFTIANVHYRGLSDQWKVEVTYVGGGPRQHFTGTMTQVQAFMLRTLILTGQPKN